MNDAQPVLTLSGLSSGYGAATVVRDVSLELRSGEILTVLGKNGMGKTTLLKTIMGFINPIEGKVSLGTEDITGQSPHVLAHAGIAYAPQEFTLFQDLTVGENLRLGVTDDATFKSRLPTLENVFPRMLERLRQRAGTLSGGEQKMLLMSRALLARPKLLLVDEISEGLQPTMIEQMAKVLRQAREDNGTAVLLVEQHLAFALSVADQFAVLKLGEIVEQGVADDSAASLLANHLNV